MVLSAVFAALVFAATAIAKFSIPATNGYVHFGDSIVLTAGFLLGPVYGVFAAATGSMLADILGGYASYALPTFIIKGLMALSAWAVYKIFKKHRIIGRIFGGMSAVLVMVAGYFLTEAVFLSYGLGALASVPWNIVQGTFGVVSSVIITEVLTANKYIADFLSRLGFLTDGPDKDGDGKNE